MTEQTIRRNGKWVKITKRTQRWVVAQGWEGQFQAVRSFLYPTKTFALVAANNWLDD